MEQPELGERSAAAPGEALDALGARVALVAADGTVTRTTARWAEETTAPAVGEDHEVACRAALGASAEDWTAIAVGLRAVLDGRRHEFRLRYHRQEGTERRWSVVRAVALSNGMAVLLQPERRRAALMADAGLALEASLDVDRTCQALAELCARAFGDVCLVDLVDARGAVTRHGGATTEAELRGRTKALRERGHLALSERHPVLRATRENAVQLGGELTDARVADFTDDERHRRMMHELSARSYAVLPLRARGTALGALSMLSARPDRYAAGEELEELGELAYRGALAIDNARLYTQRSRTAQALQRSLRPPELPSSERLRLAARFRPAATGLEVGGDFYDAFRLRRGCWGLAIGDVCGKGAEAAALTSLARHTLRTAGHYERRPARVLRALNDAILAADHDLRFCTAVYAVVREMRRALRVTCVGAGHPAPLIVRRDGDVRPLEVTGTVLGVVEEPHLRERTTTLRAGDALVLYTDGVADGAAPARQLTAEQIGARLAERAAAGAAELARHQEGHVLAVSEGAPRDDLAILAMSVPSRRSTA